LFGRGSLSPVSMAVGGLLQIASLALPWATTGQNADSHSGFYLGSVLAASLSRTFPAILLVGGFVAIGLAVVTTKAPRLSSVICSCLALVQALVVAWTLGIAFALSRFRPGVGVLVALLGILLLVLATSTFVSREARP
jgi:hypothetical protein